MAKETFPTERELAIIKGLLSWNGKETLPKSSFTCWHDPTNIRSAKVIVKHTEGLEIVMCGRDCNRAREDKRGCRPGKFDVDIFRASVAPWLVAYLLTHGEEAGE